MQGGGRKPAYNLRSGPALLFENRPYCLECHANRRIPRCALETCQQVLAGEVYFALDNYWHPQCFRCEGCSRPLEGGNYYLTWPVTGEGVSLFKTETTSSDAALTMTSSMLQTGSNANNEGC
uniref:LIM zinc-binding domain-containing protein n=1 Tax=Meloidogyne hapla TaxID=6305 RepID=A0A1I8BYI2_MELHA